MEKRRREERDGQEPRGSFRGLLCEEEEREDEQRQERVGAGLGGVEEEKRGDGGEEDEPRLRRPRRERKGPAENGERRGEGRDARGQVGREEALPRKNERFLEEVEERRSGVVLERRDEIPKREPRGPGREDLVEPQRPVEKKPGPRENGRDGNDRDGREREAVSALLRRCDALS